MNLIKQLAISGALAYGGVALARYTVRKSRAFPWREQRVLITGGSRGLGLVIARQLAAQGARLAIIARSSDDLETARQELDSRGADVLTQPCDVRESSQVRYAIENFTTELGGIDVVFNVAGIIEVGPFDSMATEAFDNSMRTNCWGALHIIKAVLPGMRERGHGRIVNVASMGGKRAVPHMLPYAASKFALVGLSNGLRAELSYGG